MKRFSKTLALLAVAATASTAALLAPTAAHAQSAPQREPIPESEMPHFDFGDLHVEQKFNMGVGVRAISGPKVTFSGQGNTLGSLAPALDPSITDQAREYHDGFVGLDTRTGATDGKTNTWGLGQSSQLVNGDADVAMHLYRAEIVDGGTHRDKSSSDLGVELLATRDMGKIGKRLQWQLFAGVSVNSVSGSARDNVTASVTTLRDLYSLAGQTLPSGPPYSAPSFTTDPDDSSIVIDTSIHLGRAPDSRSTTTDVNSAQVFNAWKLKGTYLTFRAGPTLIYDISEKIKLSISAGPVLLYAGTTYTVESLLVPDTGADIVTRMEDSDSKALFGYYADATLHYMITERAGFYAGAFYQTGDDYTQTVEDGTGGHYSSHIDLDKLTGFRAGLQYKF